MSPPPLVAARRPPGGRSRRSPPDPRSPDRAVLERGLLLRPPPVEARRRGEQTADPGLPRLGDGSRRPRPVPEEGGRPLPPFPPRRAEKLHSRQAADRAGGRRPGTGPGAAGSPLLVLESGRRHGPG